MIRRSAASSGKRAFNRNRAEDTWDFDKRRTTKHYVQNTHRQAATTKHLAAWQQRMLAWESRRE